MYGLTADAVTVHRDGDLPRYEKLVDQIVGDPDLALCALSIGRMLCASGMNTGTVHATAGSILGPVPADPVAGAGGCTGPTGPDVFMLAAGLLPEVVGAGPVCSGCVHGALFEVLCRLGAGADRFHRLRLADEARDMFAAYVVAVGWAVPRERVSATVRGWVAMQDLTSLRAALTGAAGYWRRVLDPPVSSGWDGGG